MSETEAEAPTGTHAPSIYSRNNLSERFFSDSTEQTMQAASFRDRNFSGPQSLHESSTQTEVQKIGIKIIVPPPRKICDRLLGRKCPPAIAKPEVK